MREDVRAALLKASNSGIGRRLPPSIKQLVPVSLLQGARLGTPEAPIPTRPYLRRLMEDRYHVKNLVGTDPVEFRRRIEEFESLNDAAMEGYQSAEGQRGRSVRFEWGSNFDFGDFKVQSPMRDRPLGLVSKFIDWLDAMPKTLDGMRVLDLGCWTGGTSLLLAAMGADVVAVEEVRKYVDCLTYLKDSFGVANLEPRRLSLFDLRADEFQDAFDIVLYAGLLYHLSDPVVGTRITFNCLRPGGKCLMETAVFRSDERVLRYAGRNEKLNGKVLAGANWFYPSPRVAEEIMEEVGYTNLRSKVTYYPTGNRMLVVGTKVDQVDMLRAGLSVPTIR